MLASRAMALARLERFEEAAEWTVKAAARPNAHPHILAIAAHVLALAGRSAEAEKYVSAIRKTVQHYTVKDFLTAFQLDQAGQRLFRIAARRLKE